MRLLVLFVLTVLLKSGDSKTIKVEFGLYCPDKTNWEYKITSKVDELWRAAEADVKATDHFEFRTLDNEGTEVTHLVSHTCTADGKWLTSVLDFSAADKNVVYFFIALNLKSKSDLSGVYEKLFVHYLQKECPTGDCSAIRDRILASCKFTQDINEVKMCTDNFEKALKLWMEERNSISNTTIFIIIGSVVGVVLLIALVVTYFLCKKKKNKQAGSGMTGTGTNSKTMTKSGTTKQGTTTGTFQKTGTIGTGNTGNITTGGQRY
ncbi:unnamed protein product [Caenorhabditis brenneri]